MVGHGELAREEKGRREERSRGRGGVISHP
jgi:hypothetical protein